MFRIVENSDGSTSILDRLSGKLLTVIPAKSRSQKEPPAVEPPASTSVLSPRSVSHTDSGSDSDVHSLCLSFRTRAIAFHCRPLLVLLFAPHRSVLSPHVPPGL